MGLIRLILIYIVNCGIIYGCIKYYGWWGVFLLPILIVLIYSRQIFGE